MKNLEMKERDWREIGWKVVVKRCNSPMNIREACDNLFKLCLSDYDYPGGNELHLQEINERYIRDNYNVKKLYPIFELGFGNENSILSINNDNYIGSIVGFMLLEEPMFNKEYKDNLFENEEKEEEALRKIAQAELDLYTTFINNDIYDLIFYKDGHYIDKKYDFYGKDINKNGMKEAIYEVIDYEYIADQFIKQFEDESFIDKMIMLT
jgi:hypothetical protein